MTTRSKNGRLQILATAGCAGVCALALAAAIAPEPLLATEAADGPSEQVPAVMTVPDDPYNADYLHADERGCLSCHADIQDIYNAVHAAPVNTISTVQDVQICQDCHDNGQAGPSDGTQFGSLIHGIHATVTANCWSCHNATGNGRDMQLWDVAKYDVMQGIVKLDASEVPDAAFTFTQDETLSMDQVFSINSGAETNAKEWCGVSPDLEGEALEAEQERVWNEWTFTMQGNVEQERTWTLDELIAEFPAHEVDLKVSCFHNPVGGSIIGSAHCTGIKLSDVFEAVGADMASDYAVINNASGMDPCCTLDRLENTYLVYAIDGKPLEWRMGYPLAIWYPDYTNPAVIHCGTGVTLCSGGPYMNLTAGAVDTQTGAYKNNPNVGVMDYQNGTVYQLGDTVTLHGYADAWNRQISGVEFSLDGGETWTVFETPDTNLENWVTWDFSFVPTTAGSYVVQVRSLTSDGAETPRSVSVLVNVVGEAEDDPYAGMPPEMIAAAKEAADAQ